jgi:hypothetical protein
MNEVPNSPGIYIASPRGAHLVPVTQDPRYVDSCARVNDSNVKVGKAKSLAVRHRNYITDFGEANIRYIPLAVLIDIQRAETTILRRLKAFRKLSPKGGRMDWLEGIDPRDVIGAVFDSLNGANIDHQRIWDEADV